MMLRFPYVCAISLALATLSCTSAKQESRTDVVLREVTADLTDIKQQMHNTGVDMRLLEERTKAQENEMDSLRGKWGEAQQQQKRLVQTTVGDLEKQVANMSTQRERMVADLQSLKKSINDLNASLAQYQSKLQQMETNYNTNSQQTEKNISGLKSAVSSLASLVQQNPLAGSPSTASGTTYRVQPGDSLERIARRYNTTVDSIKQLNNLKSDLIVVGSELRVP